jgi:formiminotetrahydrofolate cyclodeaminase
MTNVDPYLAMPVGRLLEEIASEKPAPGAGSTAALVVAMGAGLVSMAARLSVDEWHGARSVIDRAEEIRARVAPLAAADAAAFEDVLIAMRLPRHLEDEVREAAIDNALARAAEVPLQIAREAAEIAELGALVAERGNQRVRGEAVTGSLLAASAGRAAANLVTINRGADQGDERIGQARALVASAETSAERAVAAR